MAYNYYPMGYYSMPYTAQMTPYNVMNEQAGTNNQGQQNSAVSGIIWVQGETGAKAYPVAPNQTVQLWDSESETIYLKSADASGMPTMKILDYTIREQGAKKDMSEYITREEFEKKLAELRRAHESAV